MGHLGPIIKKSRSGRPMTQTITDRKGITFEVLRTKQYKNPDNTMFYVKRPRGKRTYCVWQYANGVMTEATAWGWV